MRTQHGSEDYCGFSHLLCFGLKECLSSSNSLRGNIARVGDGFQSLYLQGTIPGFLEDQHELTKKIKTVSSPYSSISPWINALQAPSRFHINIIVITIASLVPHPFLLIFKDAKRRLGTGVNHCWMVPKIGHISLLSLAHLSEADLSIVVLVDLFDHGLEGKVGLGLTKLLHHQLQLHEVNEVTVIYIVSVRGGGGERERKERAPILKLDTKCLQSKKANLTIPGKECMQHNQS